MEKNTSSTGKDFKDIDLKLEDSDNCKNNDLSLKISIGDYEESEFFRRIQNNSEKKEIFLKKLVEFFEKNIKRYGSANGQVKLEIQTRDFFSDVKDFVEKKFPEEYKQTRLDSFIFAVHSVRFMPHWDPLNTNQIVGLIELMNHIRKIDPSPKKMLEIGTYTGESASIFLSFDNIEKLYCVDTCDFYDSSVSQNILEEICKKRLSGFTEGERCVFFKESSFDFLERNESEYFDIIYIDGGHLDFEVKKDMEGSWRCLKKGGFLCGHDYETEDVKKIVDNFITDNSINKSTFQLFRDGSWCFVK